MKAAIVAPEVIKKTPAAVPIDMLALWASTLESTS